MIPAAIIQEPPPPDWIHEVNIIPPDTEAKAEQPTTSESYLVALTYALTFGTHLCTHPSFCVAQQGSSFGRPLGTFAGFTSHALDGARIVSDRKYTVPGMPPAPTPTFGCDYCERKFLTSSASSSHTRSKHKSALAGEANARSPETFFSSSRSLSIVDLTSSPASSSKASASPQPRSPPIKYEPVDLTSSPASSSKASASPQPRSAPIKYEPIDFNSSPASSSKSSASPRPRSPPIKYEPMFSSSRSISFASTPPSILRGPLSEAGEWDIDSDATQEYAPDAADIAAEEYEYAPVSPRSASFFEVAQLLSIPFDQPAPGDYTSHTGECFPMNRVRPGVLSDRAWWWRRRANMTQRRRDQVVDEAEARGPFGYLYSHHDTPLFGRAGLTAGPLLAQQWAALLATQRLSTTFYEGVWIELDAEMFGAVTVSGMLHVA
jgi:hypothetical protein